MGCSGGVSYFVGILVFQGGDRDDVYAVGALVGGVMRDFDFSTREISTFQPERFRVFITRDFVFAIKADFYISMSRYGRLHSDGLGDDMKIPPGCDDRRLLRIILCLLYLYFYRTSFSI